MPAADTINAARTAVLPGDGIGPEVAGAADEVLEALARQESFDLTRSSGGGGLVVADSHVPKTTEEQLMHPHLLRLWWAANLIGRKGRGPETFPDVRMADGTLCIDC